MDKVRVQEAARNRKEGRKKSTFGSFVKGVRNDERMASCGQVALQRLNENAN